MYVSETPARFFDLCHRFDICPVTNTVGLPFIIHVGRIGCFCNFFFNCENPNFCFKIKLFWLLATDKLGNSRARQPPLLEPATTQRKPLINLKPPPRSPQLREWQTLVSLDALLFCPLSISTLRKNKNFNIGDDNY